MSKFRSKIWDPMLIVSQIISMQFLFYSSLLIFNYLLNEFVNLANFSGQIVYSLDQIFDYRLLNLKNAHNSFVCFSFFFNSILSSFFYLAHSESLKAVLRFYSNCVRLSHSDLLDLRGLVSFVVIFLARGRAVRHSHDNP